jgi:hypothetical protein
VSRVLLLAVLELLDPEKEGVTLLRNVGNYLPVVTAKYVRRSDLQSSKCVGEYHSLETFIMNGTVNE